MKIILSTDPIKFPLTGIGRYTYELAKGLQKENLEDLLFLNGFSLEKNIPALKEANPMAKAPLWKSLVQKNPLAVHLYRQINPWMKGRTLNGLKDYLFHGPNYYLPPFDGPSIVTIHDLSAYLWSSSHPAERVRYMQAEIELALKRASAIITDTEFTKHEVAHFFGWPLDKIFAIPLACSPSFKPRPSEEVATTLSHYGLQYNAYTLAISTIEPRKNIQLLISAYERLDPCLRSEFPLVLAGYTGWKNNDLHRRIETAQKQGWLRYLGYIPHSNLPLLFSGARLFSYPSHYEGFGLPVLEAMASGVPVLCSNASTLPEIAGDAALFHDPHDEDELFNLLKKGLEDDRWQKEARIKGLAQSSQFSWSRTVQQTIEAYRNTKKLS